MFLLQIDGSTPQLGKISWEKDFIIYTDLFLIPLSFYKVFHSIQILGLLLFWPIRKKYLKLEKRGNIRALIMIALLIQKNKWCLEVSVQRGLF